MVMKNARGSDLNLLVVFDALMAERNVTTAGERIGLAQPSMSNALTRLRALFQDELFVRTPEGMMPTPIASAAAEHVRTAIVAAEEALNIGTEFRPETAKGTIVLLTNDFIEFTILPGIMQAVAQQAPGIRLQTRPLLGEDFAHHLDAGLADFAIAAPAEVPKRFRSTTLFDEHFDGIARKGHAILENPITMESYLACKHVAVSHRFGGWGVIEESLKEIDLALDLAVAVSNLASVPPLVMTTDYIAAVPRRLADLANRELDIVSFELPYEVPSVEAKLICGRGIDGTPMFTWFRSLVLDCLHPVQN